MSAQSSRRRDFEFITRLGTGAFGEVYKVRRKESRAADRKIYVVKQVKLSGLSHQEQKDCVREVSLLASLDFRYITRYYDSFIEDVCLHIVMEFAEHGDIYSRLQKTKHLDIEIVWKWFIQLTLALNHLHEKLILHRDLKPMNVFLDGHDDVKLGDLGVAKLLATESAFAKTLVGTPYYLSPELCENRPYNQKSDIWALGIILYEMCMNRKPFEATNHAALVLKIVRGKYISIDKDVPGDLADENIVTHSQFQIIRSCLRRDPAKRPTAKDILSLPRIVQKSRTVKGVPDDLFAGVKGDQGGEINKGEMAAISRPLSHVTAAIGSARQCSQKPAQSRLPGVRAEALMRQRREYHERIVRERAQGNLRDASERAEIAAKKELSRQITQQGVPRKAIATLCRKPCAGDVRAEDSAEEISHDGSRRRMVAVQLFPTLRSPRVISAYDRITPQEQARLQHRKEAVHVYELPDDSSDDSEEPEDACPHAIAGRAHVQALPEEFVEPRETAAEEASLSSFSGDDVAVVSWRVLENPESE